MMTTIRYVRPIEHGGALTRRARRGALRALPGRHNETEIASCCVRRAFVTTLPSAPQCAGVLPVYDSEAIFQITARRKIGARFQSVTTPGTLAAHT